MSRGKLTKIEMTNLITRPCLLSGVSCPIVDWSSDIKEEDPEGGIIEFPHMAMDILIHNTSSGIGAGTARIYLASLDIPDEDTDTNSAVKVGKCYYELAPGESVRIEGKVFNLYMSTSSSMTSEATLDIVAQVSSVKRRESVSNRIYHHYTIEEFTEDPSINKVLGITKGI